MRSALDTFVTDRQRVNAGRARYSANAEIAAAELVEVLGPIGARRWVDEVSAEIGYTAPSTSLVIALADIANRVDADDEAVIVAAVSALTGGQR